MFKNYLLTLFIILQGILCSANSTVKSNQTILVIGATGEIGKVIAEQLRLENFNLILVSRNVNKLKLLQQDLAAKYKKLNITTLVIDYNDYFLIEKNYQKFIIYSA